MSLSLLCFQVPIRISVLSSTFLFVGKELFNLLVFLNGQFSRQYWNQILLVHQTGIQYFSQQRLLLLKLILMYYVLFVIHNVMLQKLLLILASFTMRYVSKRNVRTFSKGVFL